MKHVYILALIIFGVMIGTPLAQLTEPSVDRIVKAINGLVTQPGQTTVGMGGSLVQCRAQNTEQTVTTNAFNINAACDLYGRLTTVSYTTKDKWVRGGASATTTAAATFTGFTAVASTVNYVTSIQCFRTDAGTTMIYVTLNDTGVTAVPIPATSGAAIVFPIPLSTAVNTALTMTESAATSTVFCNAQGYQGA